MNPRLEIKKRMMEVGWATKRQGVAEAMTAVDALVDIYTSFPKAELWIDGIDYEWANSTLQDVLVVNMKTTPGNLAEAAYRASRVKNTTVVALLNERRLTEGQTLEALVKILAGNLTNILPLVLVEGIDQTGWFPAFVSKADPRIIETKYRKYEVFLGEGWGKLEGTEEARKHIVDKKLFDSWLKEIVPIEERREQQRQSAKPLPKQDANDKHKTT